MNNLESKQKIILIIAIIAVVGVIGYYIFTISNKEDNYYSLEENQTMTQTQEEHKEEEKIQIHITGEVKNQGVVKISEEGRIQDAIDAAGGLTENADIEKINLAYKLEDGLKIYIPSKSDCTKAEVENQNQETEGQSAEKKETTNQITSQNAQTKSKTNTTNSKKDYANLDIYISSDAGENVIKDNSQTINTNTSKININKANQVELEALPGVGPSIATKIINYRIQNGEFKKIDDIKNVNGIGESKFESLKEYIEI